MKEKYVFDIETDDLNATKIHCLAYCNVDDGVVHFTTDYQEMRNFFLRDVIFIGHSIIRFDIPVAEKILKINIVGRKIDTLALSWYISPERNRHGLQYYGEEYGIEKPKISDWIGLGPEVYINRCKEDVKINLLLWRRQWSYLRELYDRDEAAVDAIISYLSFKLACIADQEKLGVKLNVPYCQEMLSKLEREREIKMVELIAVMPKVPVISLRMPPKVVSKKDGSPSTLWESWASLLKEKNLPENHTEGVEVIRGWEDGNPGSHEQVKKWIYTMGWKPMNIKHVRDKKTNTVKRVPQISSREGAGEICESIKALYPIEPKLELLNGLSILSHRIGVFKAFLEDAKDGVLYPSIAGITNTLRMQHSIIVNLPGLGKKYGEEVRACLIPFDNHQFVGSDLKNIEDRTKRHYIYVYDPEYVEDMNVEGYDSHTDIGVLAGMMTIEEEKFYKWYAKPE